VCSVLDCINNPHSRLVITPSLVRSNGGAVGLHDSHIAYVLEYTPVLIVLFQFHFTCAPALVNGLVIQNDVTRSSEAAAIAVVLEKSRDWGRSQQTE